MTIDPTFTADTEVRLLKIEIALSDLWRMMGAVINKEQFNRINVINQKALALLQARITELETDVTTLQEQVNNLL